MRCTIFSPSNATKLCGRQANRYLPLAIGQVAQMHEMDDALLCGYIPLCAHHCEMVPPNKRLFELSELRGIAPELPL